MKSVEVLLRHLHSLDIKLYTDGNNLRCNAPKGKLTATLKEQLSEHKTEILSFLQTANGISDHSDYCQPLPQIYPAPDERYQPFPLTDVQQAYWVGRNDVFELSNVSTHAYAEIDIVNLDLKRFEYALNRVIKHHEMMRAIVLPDGTQKILEEVSDYEIDVLDLCASDLDTQHTHLMAIRDRMSHQVLPIDQYPLFEFRAVKLSESKTRLYCSIDLMISDAWSFDVLKRDFIQLIHYPGSSLTPLNLSFRDYVLAELSLRGSERYHRSLAYWRNRLRALPPAPEIPLDKNLAAIDRPRFVHYTGRLEPDTWNRLKQRGKRANLTPSVVVLAAFAEILTAWSKDPRFTINVTLFKRFPLHPQVNQIVGDFTSLALLAVDNSDRSSFEVRAKRIQKQLWDDIDHRYVSGLEVLREIAKLQKRPSGALMPVVYTSTLGNDSIDTETFVGSLTQKDDLPNSEIGEIVYGLSQTPQVYLDHQAIEDDGAFIFNWDAIKNIFPPGLLDEMFAAYEDLLHRLANSEELWTSPVHELFPAHQLQSRASINFSEDFISKAALLHEPFTNQVLLRPQHPAVVSSHKTLTYQELNKQASYWGNQLRNSEVRPNQLVAVVMTKGWEQVVAVLSILMAGAAYVPIDPELPIERRNALLKQSEVQWVLTQSHFNSILDWPDNVHRLCIDAVDTEKWETSESHQPIFSIQTPDDLAYVIYTSGSTGMPKGVMIDHQGAVNTILDINQRFQISENDRVLALSSLSFDLSVYDIFGTLSAGGTIVIPDADGTRTPAHWAKMVTQHQVTIWNSVPALMQLFIEYAEMHPELNFYPLRLVLLSGDWIPLSLPDQIKRISEKAQVISLGGATEASIWSILYPIEAVHPDWKSIPYGLPMTNQQFYVLNHALELVPTWVPGQLYIGGIGLAKGYWHDENKTSSSFIKHPHTGERIYRTGDLGRYLPDGTIEFLGREDFQVKVGGYRIELGEIESTLRQYPALKEVVVMAVGERHENKRLVAYVVPHDPEEKNPVTQKDLYEFSQGFLPNYMIPSTCIFLESLPLTSNGKINRRALLELYKEEPQSEQIYVQPRTPIEELLAKLWTQILDIESIGTHDNFFESGGDSIRAIRLVTQANEAKLNFKIRDIFEYPTIAELAQVSSNQLSKHQSDFPKLGLPINLSGNNLLIDIQSKGSRPPLFCFAPAIGDVSCYFSLASCLGTEQPVYGLRLPTISKLLQDEQDHLEAIAAAQVKELLALHPQGPYYLAGQSMGGIIAYEVAQQLSQKGHEVALVALIDVAAQDPKVLDSLLNCSDAVCLAGMFTQQSEFFSAEELEKINSEHDMQYVLAKAKDLDLVSHDFDISQAHHVVSAFKQNVKMQRDYMPKTYAGKVTLFRALDRVSDQSDAYLGWAELVQGKIETYQIPGNHFSILHQPNVKDLATQLNASIGKALGLKA